MISLIIETSTEKGAAALFKDGKEAARIDLPVGMQNSQHLIPELEKLLQGTGVNLKDLSFIGVGIGPGSYTGMRVGAMVAKTLSYALKIPLVGVTSLEAFLPEKGAAVIDAKIGGVYVLMEEGEPQVLPLPEAARVLGDVTHLATPTIEPLRTKLESGNTKQWTWEEWKPNLSRLNLSAQAKFKAGDYSQDGQLTLLYLRKTQAEIERDQKSCG